MVQIGEGVAAPASGKGKGGDEDPDYESATSRVLQMYVYSTKNAANYVLMFSNYARKALKMLREHRLELRAYPGLPTIMGDNDLILDWEADITLHDHKEQIMDLSQKRKPTPEDALPVILCTITDEVGDNGEKLNYKGRPFVLIYGNHHYVDNVTLLHEIGHAANCTFHPPWGLGRPDKHYSFMATPAEFPADSKEAEMIKKPEYYRNTIFKKDVVRLAGAPFSVNKALCYYPPMFFGG